MSSNPGRLPDLAEGLLSRQSVPPRLVGEPAPPQADIDAMLAAAVRAPDHGALRPWRFHVIAGAARERLGEIFVEALLRREPAATPETVEKERSRPLRAPLIIAVCAKIDRSLPEKIPPLEQIVSAGAACQNILLAAHAMGYGAIMLTGVNARDPHVKAAFELDAADEIVAFIYIGTPLGPVYDKPRPQPSDLTTIW